MSVCRRMTVARGCFDAKSRRSFAIAEVVEADRLLEALRVAAHVRLVPDRVDRMRAPAAEEPRSLELRAGVALRPRAGGAPIFRYSRNAASSLGPPLPVTGPPSLRRTRRGPCRCHSWLTQSMNAPASGSSREASPKAERERGSSEAGSRCPSSRARPLLVGGSSSSGDANTATPSMRAGFGGPRGARDLERAVTEAARDDVRELVPSTGCG